MTIIFGIYFCLDRAHDTQSLTWDSNGKISKFPKIPLEGEILVLSCYFKHHCIPWGLKWGDRYKSFDSSSNSWAFIAVLELGRVTLGHWVKWVTFFYQSGWVGSAQFDPEKSGSNWVNGSYGSLFWGKNL